MKFPTHLSQWHSLLTLFPEDIAAAFSELLVKLAPLIGDLAHDELDGQTEPDGYSGLTRKVNYERLLLSEWAINEYHPDEFMRKAVSGEHQFLAVSKKEKRQTKVCVALFDCGPTQLGQPRIVQLALLILLARRAEAANAEFLWSVCQDPSLEFFNEVDEHKVRRFLNARSIHSIAQENIESKLMSVGDDIDDLWIIGHEKLDFLPTDSHFISLKSEFLNPEILALNITKANKNSKQIRLQLPDKANQAQVLRDPFKVRHLQTAATIHSKGSWLIGCNGRQVAFQNQLGEVEVYGIPLKPDKNATKVIRKGIPKPGRKLLGVFLRKRGIQLLTYDRQHFYFNDKDNLNKETLTPRLQLIKPVENRLRSVMVSNVNDHILLCDDRKALRQIQPQLTMKNVTTLYENVIHHDMLGSCGVCIANDPDNKTLTLAWFVNQVNGKQKEFDYVTDRTPGVLIHGSGNWSLSHIGCFAYETEYHTWKIIAGYNEFQITTGPEIQVIGVMAHSKKILETNDANGPCLIGVNPDTGSVVALADAQGSPQTILLGSLPKGANNIQFNSHHPMLHFDDADGDFITLDLRNFRELLRLEVNQ